MSECICGQSFALKEMVLAHQTYCPMIPKEKQESKKAMLEFLVPIHSDTIIRLTRQQEEA